MSRRWKGTVNRHKTDIYNTERPHVRFHINQLRTAIDTVTPIITLERLQKRHSRGVIPPGTRPEVWQLSPLSRDTLLFMFWGASCQTSVIKRKAQHTLTRLCVLGNVCMSFCLFFVLRDWRDDTRSYYNLDACLSLSGSKTVCIDFFPYSSYHAHTILTVHTHSSQENSKDENTNVAYTKQQQQQQPPAISNNKEGNNQCTAATKTLRNKEN